MDEFPPFKEFREWLKALPAQDEGLTADWGSRNCPLALFIEDKGAAKPWISPGALSGGHCLSYWTDAHGDDGQRRRMLPYWANEFAMRIDTFASTKQSQMPEGNLRYNFAPVTPRECLRVLSRIKQVDDVKSN